MNALKFCFFYFVLKSVNGLPDFSDLPTIDNFLQQSINESADLCNEFTSHACTLTRGDDVVFKEHYLLRIKRYIKLVATEILNFETLFHERNRKPRKIEATNLDPLFMEKMWFKTCLGRYESRETSFYMLKDIMSEAGNVQHHERTKDSTPWQEVAEIYGRKFGCSTFFEVVLEDDDSLLIRRPLTMMPLGDFTLRAPFLLQTFVRQFVDRDEFSIDNISEIQKKLFKLTKALHDYNMENNVQYHKMSVGRFSKIFNNAAYVNFDWLQHFRAIGMDINEDDELNFDMNYFDWLRDILSAHKNADIANFIHFMNTMNSIVMYRWYKSYDAYEDRVRLDKCYKQLPIQSGYIEKLIEEKAPHQKSFIKKMLKRIIEEHKIEIENSWLNDKVKEIFLSKLNNLQLKIVNFKYKPLLSYDVNNDFTVGLIGLENLANFEKANLRFKVFKYRHTLNLNEFISPALRKYGNHLVPFVNYNVPDNYLEIPLAELLITPLFNSELPTTWNYAYFGVAISRELSKLHWKIYSEYGKYSEPLFTKRRCFQGIQYPLSDEVKFDDLIDSCVGLKLAYRAFKREMHETPNGNHIIPRLSYANLQQQFFIAYSAIYCEETKPKEIRATVANSGSFARASFCEINTPMNPEKKCDLWEKE